MDIGKAFTFVADDPRWVNKVLIGGGLVFLGLLASLTLIGGVIVFAIVFGYLVGLARNVIAGQERPLPEWADWGVLLRDGCKLFVVWLVLALPFILLGLLVFIPGIALSASGDPDTAELGGVVAAGGYCLTFPLSMAVNFVLPLATGRYAATRSIGESLRLGELWAVLRGNGGTYLLVFLLTFFATSLVAYLGLLACGIGLPFTVFYAYLVNHHLYGQAYRGAMGTPPGYGQPPPSSPRAFPS